MSLVLCSDEDKQAFEAWHAHDDAEDNFCELDGECRAANNFFHLKGHMSY